MPLEAGSTTPMAKQDATAASIALPPCASIRRPARVASRSLVATIALGARASSLTTRVMVGWEVMSYILSYRTESTITLT